jgi:uncharacterized protein (TIGR03083 family)
LSGLTVSLAEARPAFTDQVRAFVAAVDGLDDHQLLAASRCHGWTVLDVLVHVRGGLEEMLRGFTAPTADPVTHDAATYWTAWAAAATDDPIDGVLWTRRTASAYRRPRSALPHLRDAADAVLTAARLLVDTPVRFQGQVLAAGDFLTIWIVELAVHQADLGRELELPVPPPAALRLTRATIEALLGALPTGLTDLEVLLLGSGRAAVPPELSSRIHPVFG